MKKNIETQLQESLEREKVLVEALTRIDHKIQFGFKMGHAHAMVKLEHCKDMARQALISVGAMKPREL